MLRCVFNLSLEELDGADTSDKGTHLVVRCCAVPRHRRVWHSFINIVISLSRYETEWILPSICFLPLCVSTAGIRRHHQCQVRTEKRSNEWAVCGKERPRNDWKGWGFHQLVCTLIYCEILTDAHHSFLFPLAVFLCCNPSPFPPLIFTSHLRHWRLTAWYACRFDAKGATRHLRLAGCLSMWAKLKICTVGLTIISRLWTTFVLPPFLARRLVLCHP